MNDNPLPNRYKYGAEIKGYRPGIIQRLLLALHIVKAPKASSCVPNWHFSNVDTTGELVSIHCVRDGKSVSVMHYVPPEHKSPPIIHV